MLKHKAYKFRLYPNDEQIAQIENNFNCTRFVYNAVLERRIKAYQRRAESMSKYDCIKLLPEMKKFHKFLKSADSIALQAAIENLSTAYDNFFAHRAKYPKFKSKKRTKHSFTTKQNGGCIILSKNTIKLPKLGFVKFQKSRTVKGKILNVTISRNCSGKYYISICCEVDIEPKAILNNNIGIDLGIKSFAFDSEGSEYINPKILNKYQKQLLRAQRQLSRKQKGSNNRTKQRIKLSAIHEKIANCRNDFLQKISTQIINDNQVICVENLKVKNMLKNHKLAKSISDVSWSKFVTMLQYKADWYGKRVIKIDTFYPSSQTCNVCGSLNPLIKDLKIRNWVCPNCGTSHNRDMNAAINILNKGLEQIA